MEKESMSRRSDPWNDIETLYDAVRVEEEAQLAVLEALGELYDPAADEFSWDELFLDESPWDEGGRARRRFYECHP